MYIKTGINFTAMTYDYKVVVTFDNTDLDTINSTQWYYAEKNHRVCSIETKGKYLDDLLFARKGLSGFDKKFVDGNGLNLRRANMWITNAPKLRDEGGYLSVQLPTRSRRMLLDYIDIDIAMMPLKVNNHSYALVEHKFVENVPVHKIISVRMNHVKPALNHANGNIYDNRRFNLTVCRRIRITDVGTHFVITVGEISIYIDAKDVDIIYSHQWSAKKEVGIVNEDETPLSEIIIGRICGFPAPLDYLDGNVLNNRRDNFGLSLELGLHPE